MLCFTRCLRRCLELTDDTLHRFTVPYILKRCGDRALKLPIARLPTAQLDKLTLYFPAHVLQLVGSGCHRSSTDSAVAISDRCMIRTRDGCRVVVISGVPPAQFIVGDRELFSGHAP